MPKHYTNPTPLYLIAQIIKKQNISLIENYCKSNNLSNKKQTEMIDNYIKLNHYYPNVVQKQNREILQCYLIK